MADKNNLTNQVQGLTQQILKLKQDLVQKETVIRNAVGEKKKMGNDLKAKEAEYKQKEQELLRIKNEIPQIRKRMTDQEEASRKMIDIEIPNLKKELATKEGDLVKIRQTLAEVDRQLANAKNK